MGDGVMVDRNGMRFGAGLSAAALAIAFAVDLDLVVPIVAAALALGALFGPGNAPLAWIYRALRASILRGVPPEPEPQAPPRFAQTLGAVVLIAASLALFAAEREGLGWALAMLVAVLQALLATTGICIGCEIYVFARRVRTRGT